MPTKTKVIVSMLIIAFLAALTVLIVDSQIFKFYMNSDRQIATGDALLVFVFTGILTIVIYMGVSVPFILIIAKNVSEPIEKALDKTHFDTLTGIYSRRYFDENLRNLINFMSRSGNMLSMLMVDIDFFKAYNDTYGFDKGDICLKIISNTLVKCVSRTEDFVARFGGKEFVVVLPNTDENGARIIAERMLKSVRDCKLTNEKSEASGCVTVSVGVVTGKVNHSQKDEEYVSRASEMLNKSIEEGHDRYSFFLMS